MHDARTDRHKGMQAFGLLSQGTNDCHSVTYMSWVRQLGAMGCNDLLQLEEQSLPEAPKISGHRWGGVQLQATKRPYEVTHNCSKA